MPLYMDHHKNLEGLTAEAVAARTTRRTSKPRRTMKRRPLGTGSMRTRARSSACSRHRAQRQPKPSTAKRTATSRTR